MKLDEATASARRIGPIKAVDVDGNPVTDFSAPGAVEVKVNNGAYAAAAGAIVVINGSDLNPSGYVYYQATPGDASVRGFIVLKLAVVCVEMTFREEVEVVPQGIPVDTVNAALLTVGPLLARDLDGNPVLGGAGIDCEISINGSQWDAPANALAEVSDGYYDYPADPAEATARGWIAVKLSGACQEFVLRATIVTENGDVEEPEEPPPPEEPPTPIELDIEHSETPYFYVVAAALDRLPQQYRGTDDIPTELLP